MREKRRPRYPMAPSIPDDSAPVDLAATAHEIGRFETGDGWQHGVIDFLFALGAVLLLLPLGAFQRRRARTGRDRM